MRAVDTNVLIRLVTRDDARRWQRRTVHDPDVVAAALEQFRGRTAVSLSDCLVLEVARKSGRVPLGTFDRQLAKLEGTERL